MDRRNPWTIAAGLTLVVLGGLWMLSNVTDVHVPLEWVIPGLVVLTGVLLLVGRNGDGGGSPPSQFERDDAPRVP